MSDLTRTFFLQAIDPRFGCPVLETKFVVNDLAELRALLGAHADGDPELRWTYWLEQEDLAAISKRFGIGIQSEGRDVMLACWHSIRTAPYLIHTHYELFLLLDGTKKFAQMSIGYQQDQQRKHDYEDLFDEYVAKGLLHKEVELCPFAAPIVNKDGESFQGIRHVYYAVKGEEWRIAAWKLLITASGTTGWNETCERLEGMLYGYQDWQIDWWISHWRRSAKLPLENAGQNT